MSIAEHVKAIAGRWFDAHHGYQAPMEIVSAPAEPIPAGLVRAGDWVHVAERWHEVTRTEQYRSVDGNGRDSGTAMLFFGEGWPMTCRFVAQVYVREEATVIAAQIGGVK